VFNATFNNISAILLKVALKHQKKNQSTQIVLSFCFVFSSSCVPYVASFSGLSIFDCPFDVL